jgi:anti-sigma factor ChrR (cupin superfamily)
MTSPSNNHGCGQTELIPAYALSALPSDEVAVAKAHLSVCPHCRQAADELHGIVDSFATWPTDVLRPPAKLWNRLLERIGESEQPATPPVALRRPAPLWEDVAPGIACMLLSSDSTRDRVAMLVRLAPGAAYPPHTHSGVEELHLLDGELWIDENKLHPGDYNRAEPGTADRRVWSETGCTCVLMTAPSDVLG